MAWRDLMVEITKRSLECIEQCIEEDDPRKCAAALLSCADAVYSPLKPVDAGLGEAKRLSARLASLLVNYFIFKAESAGKVELVKSTYEEVKKGSAEGTEDLVRRLLEGLALEPAKAPEPREAVVMSLKDYVEPEEPTLPRRRRIPRKPDPLREVRRILREVGRQDPLLARMILEALRGRDLPI